MNLAFSLTHYIDPSPRCPIVVLLVRPVLVITAVCTSSPVEYKEYQQAPEMGTESISPIYEEPSASSVHHGEERELTVLPHFTRN